MSKVVTAASESSSDDRWREMSFHAITQPLTHRHRWWLVGISVAALVLVLFLFRALTPGIITYDSNFQLRQAVGDVGFNDWHPVAMTFVWMVLLRITGEYSSMLLVQLLFAGLAAWMTSWLLMVRTRRVAASWLGLLILVLPFTVNVLGAIWKDTQMGIALYISVILTLIARWRPRLRWSAIALAFLFILYAMLVRKNALVVAIPLVPLWLVLLRGAALLQSWKLLIFRSLAALFVLGAATFTIGAVLKSVTSTTKTSQISQVLLDDLVFSAPENAIRQSQAASESLKNRIFIARKDCINKGAIWDAYWKCYGTGAQGPFTAIADADQVQALWLDVIPKNMGAYFDYRAQTTFAFLNTSKLQFPSSVRGGWADYSPEHPRLRAAVYSYVVNYGLSQFGWLFFGMTWVIVSAVGIGTAMRRSTRSWTAIAIFGSGLLYVATFIPSAPASDYRYVFPTMVCAVLGWLAWGLGRVDTRKGAPNSKHRHRAAVSHA